MSIFNRKKIKDFLIYGSGQGVNLLIPLLIMPFIIYKCGEDGLGKIGVGFSLALILNGIIDYGSYIKGVKEIAINRQNKTVLEKKFKSIYFSKLILTILVFILLTVLIFTVPFFSKDKALFFFSFFIVIGQFINPQWFFQGVENFKWISIVNVVSKIIYIVLVLLFINTKEDYVYANLFFGIGAIIGNSIGFWWLVYRYGFELNNFSLNESIFILKDEFSLSVSQIFLSFYQYFPIILISYIGGDFMAGQFRVIDQIVSVFKTYLNMFFYFVYANICYELDKSISIGIKVWKQYNLLNFCLIFVLLFFSFFNTEFILGYFKIDKSNILLMSDYFKIGLVVPLLLSISQPLRQLMFAFNHNKTYISITIIASIVNFVLLYYLTKVEGLIGAFHSIIFIEFIIIVLYLFILRKNFHHNKLQA